MSSFRNDRSKVVSLKSLYSRIARGTQRSNRRAPRRLSVESLEVRSLMSVTPLCAQTENLPYAPALTAQAEIASTNSAPVANDDAYAINGHQQLGANVLANDTDAEGDPLSVALVTAPSHGTLAMGTDGTFTYAPDGNFDGVDLFTYLAKDGQLDSNLATVTLLIGAPNAPPVAESDLYRTDEDQVLSVTGPGVLGNDSDPDGDALRAVLVSGPRNGTLVLGRDGSFDYTPRANFFGTDTFSYKANDGQANSNPATVTITVDRVNTAPVAADDAYSTPQDQPLSVDAGGVLANDQDVDGDALAAVLASGPANGSLTLNPDGSFTYTPNAGFYGEDNFSYLANDGLANSNPATVTLTVSPVIAPPATELVIHLEVSGSPFGQDSGPTWGGATFWVNVYVEDLREIPQGVVGGAIDVAFNSPSVSPTGSVAYGGQFTDFRQGIVDLRAGVIDEGGALTTEGGVGAGSLAPFMAWQFRRSGPGAPEDPNSQVSFVADPGEGTATIQPGEFALAGVGSPLAWTNVQFETATVNLYLGDFNGDGRVNHCDLALWIPQAISSRLTGDSAPEFDLNGDSRVDEADLKLLMPRLYQPVLGETAGAAHGGVAATPHTRGLNQDADLDWVDAISSNLVSGHRRKEMAIDLALQESGHWFEA